MSFSDQNRTGGCKEGGIGKEVDSPRYAPTLPTGRVTPAMDVVSVERLEVGFTSEPMELMIKSNLD